MNLVLVDSRGGQPSWMERAWFLPLVIGLFAVGHLCDIVGTYLAQPQFEQEANHLYQWAAAQGVQAGWGEVLFLKLMYCLLVSLGFYAFVRQRHSFYPALGGDYRTFITHVFFGRPLTWLETLYRFPTNWRILPLGGAALVILSFLHPFYMGYVNLAHRFAWFRPADGFFYDERWIDLSVVPCVFVAFGTLCWLLWQDYRAPLRR